MNRLLFLAAFAGLAFASPVASAQLAGTSTLNISAPTQALTHDNTTSTGGAITYTTDEASALLNFNGIVVQYLVTKVPVWAIVTISPASDVIDLQPTPGLTSTSGRVFVVTINVDPSFHDEAVDSIEISARTITTQAVGGHSTTTKATIPVHLLADHDACPVAATQESAPTATIASPTPAPEKVSVQSAEPVAFSPISYAAVAGFIAVGAGVGLVLRKKF